MLSLVLITGFGINQFLFISWLAKVIGDFIFLFICRSSFDDLFDVTLSEIPSQFVFS